MNIQRALVLLGVLVLLAIGMHSVHAEPTPVVEADAPTPDATNRITAHLSISASGRATYSGGITAHLSDSNCKIAVRLLQKSGNCWNEVEAWHSSDSGSASIAKNCAVPPGIYKVAVSGNVTTADGIRESVRKSTAEKIRH